MHRWDAEDYNKSSSEQQKWARELIEKLGLKGDERVLDIGCGDGKVTAEISRRLPRGSVLGLDSSEEMIHFARRKFPSRRFPRLDFQIGDARSLIFDCEFDVVFSNATLHWIVGHMPVLEGIRRSLRSSGSALLQMGGKGNAQRVVKAAEAIQDDDKWSPYFAGFTFPYGFYGPEEYVDLLAKAGLKARRVELIPKDMVHKGKEGLSAWIRTTWLLYTCRVPEELRDDFIDELADTYIAENPPDPEGLVHVQMIRLEVEAER